MTAREKDYLAIALGLLAAVAAHAAGKPWWVDHPFMGDAFDVGFFGALAVRGMFAFWSGRSA